MNSDLVVEDPSKPDIEAERLFMEEKELQARAGGLDDLRDSLARWDQLLNRFRATASKQRFINARAECEKQLGSILEGKADTLISMAEAQAREGRLAQAVEILGRFPPGYESFPASERLKDRISGYERKLTFSWEQGITSYRASLESNRMTEAKNLLVALEKLVAVSEDTGNSWTVPGDRKGILDDLKLLIGQVRKLKDGPLLTLPPAKPDPVEPPD